MNSPYAIPDDGQYRSISVSGGRSSGYMLRRILDAHGGALPERTVAVFANTGKERPETLDFLREMQERWEVDITWLEYEYAPTARGRASDPKHRHRVVSHETAARDGEPFATLIRRSRMVPNVVRRICTHDLKVETIARYLRRELGWRTSLSLLGIRHDEPRRWKKAALTENCRVTYPMVEARVTRADVMRFWAGHNFDLGIDSDWGNCDLCFLKGRRKLARLIRERPELADWWIRMEEERVRDFSPLAAPEKGRFIKRESYRSLRDRALAPLPLPLDDPGEGDRVECYCGD